MHRRSAVRYVILSLLFVLGAGAVVAQQTSTQAPQVNRRERLLLYVSTPGTAGGGAVNGFGIRVFDALLKYRFVKRIPTVDLPAWKDFNDDEVKGMEVSAETGLLYLSTLTGLSAYSLATEKLVWKTLDDGSCCDRPSQSPDGKIIYVPERSAKRNQDGWLVGGWPNGQVDQEG